MASGSTLTTFDAMLKEYYTKERVENMIYADNPFFALVPKAEMFPGRELPIPIVFANPQSRSATFSQAQALSTSSASQMKAFNLTRVKDYGIITIDTETIEASEDDDGAFLEAKTTEIDGIINSVTRSLCIGLYRKGWGAIGTVGSTAGSTVTLSPISDAHNFEKNMVCVFSSSEDSAGLNAAGASLTVQGVNRSTGVITFTGAVSGASVLAADTVFVKGDRVDSASPTRLKVAGLEDWAPATAPSSTLFFNVDRTSDTRLFGVSYNGASDDIEDALIQGASQSAALGYKIDYIFTSFQKYAELEKNLNDSVRYIDLKGPAEIGFRGIVLNGPRGPIKVIADQNCPSTRAFGVQMNMLKLYSIGKAVRVLSGDGMQMLRQASDDGVEIRTGFKGNLGCKAPAAIVNIQL